MQKLYIKTHGCAMNEYDSSRMVDALRAKHPNLQVIRAADLDLGSPTLGIQ